MNGNHFEGSIPLALAECKNLQILDLGNNNLIDTFPPWLVSLPMLQVLVLRSNKLHGKLIASKMKHPFPKLRIMDLSHNQCSGNLPIDLLENFKATMIVDKLVDKNRRKRGSYYEASVLLIVKNKEVEVKKILHIYTSIDMSSNMFSGEIPGVIGKLKALRLLNISHNSFTGNIPSLLGNLNFLESFDLSSNHLTGIIPEQLTSLMFLSTSNLSEDSLSGAIPHGRQFNTFSKESFQGNLALCGVPLTKRCIYDKSPIREVDYDDGNNDDEYWFKWSMILMGYGCGLICGLSTGYTVFTTSKPMRFVLFIEGAQQKLIRRYMKNSRVQSSVF